MTGDPWDDEDGEVVVVVDDPVETVYVALRTWDDRERDCGERFIGVFATLDGAKAACEKEHGTFDGWKDYSFGSSMEIDRHRQDSIDIEITEVGP